MLLNNVCRHYKKNLSGLIFNFLLLGIFLFQFPSVINSQQQYTWNLEASPIFSNLKRVQITDDSTVIALGNQLIILENNLWKLLQPQPPVLPDQFFVMDKKSIWLSSVSIYQKSELFYYNGKSWEEVFNPLANTVAYFQFENRQSGLISGLGEIAIYNNGKWQYLNQPTAGMIDKVFFLKDRMLYAFVKENGIYEYRSSRWIAIEGTGEARIVNDDSGRIFFITDSAFCRIISNKVNVVSQNNLLSKINSFDVLSNGNVTAAGDSGLILNYKNGIWKTQVSPVKSNLNSIVMLSDTLGWIVGDNGAILKLGKEKSLSNIESWKGFDKITFYSSAKLVDDEYGVVIDDFNQDGLPDIFTCGLFEANHLYINKDNLHFKDEAEQRGVGGFEKNKGGKLNLGACAGDLDNDGNNDLYVTALNGKNKIYKNTGGGYFVDYSSISGGVGSSTDRTNSVIFGDVDNDGDLDIFVANENTTNKLFINNGAGIFDEATEETGLKTIRGGTGCSFADIDNDGDIDLYVSNWSDKNILYKNLLKEKGELFFENITETAGVGGEVFTKSNAVVFSDIDNDADLDLFVTNRKTSNRLFINNGKGIFSDRTKIMMGLDSLESYGSVIKDFNNDGFKDIYVSNVDVNSFYKNYFSKKFKKETIKYGADIKGYSTGSASADFDNDGDLDLYVANYVGEGSAILKNKLNGNNFIKLSLTGIENNRNCIGTKIFIYENNISQKKGKLIYYTEITAGSGYASMNSITKTIPVKNCDVVSAKIIFPSGISKEINKIRKGSSITITDVEGFRKNSLLFKSWILGFFLDPHKLFETLKWLFVFLLVAYSSYYGFKKYNWSIQFIFISVVGLLTLYNIQFVYLEYENILFSTILPLTSVIVVVSLLHLYYGRERIKKLSIKQRRQIREKLSRDLHDDLASTISSIGIYLTLIKYESKNGNSKLQELLNKAESLIAEAASSITDLIWAFKPRSEYLSDLVIRISENFGGLFKEKGIIFTTNLSGSSKKILLESNIKQNIYLIIKEALNNILKYAGSSNVSINISMEDKRIKIIIDDDGVGFNINDLKRKGHGLPNMKKRAEEINAALMFSTKYEKGSRIVLTMKIV